MVISAPTFLWHIHPLGALGADMTGTDRSRAGSLRGLVDWLPHVSALGADAVLLAPVFSSLSHGYDTVDHFRVDERLGTDADLDKLVAEARDRGIGVVLDGAFAYASRSFLRLDDPAERGQDPWFLRDRDDALVPWRVDALVTPDPDAPGYRAYVAQVLCHWLDRGIAGWRLDSAWSLPADFWRDVLARVRDRHPTAWFLGQYFHRHLPRVVDTTTVSTVTEYGLTRAIRAWLAGGPADAMAAALYEHAENSVAAPTHTFLGNHDVIRLADAVPATLVPAAFALLLTLPGIPAIYYGDELATTSRWRHNGDDDALLRPPLTPAALAETRHHDLLTAVTQLGQFRAARPWLTTAELRTVTTTDGALAYELGRDKDLVGVGINPTQASVTLPATETFPATVVPPHEWVLRTS